MCVEERKPGKVILFADCPSLDYLDNFLNNELLKSVTISAINPATIVLHSCSIQVLNHPQYVNWIRKFPPTTTHLILCQGLHTSNGIFYSSDALIKALGEVNNDFFEIQTQADPLKLKSEPETIPLLTIADNLKTLQLEPTVKLCESYKSSFNIIKCEDFDKTVDDLNENLKKVDNIEIEDSRCFITLGTGSCVPGKLRNGNFD